MQKCNCENCRNKLCAKKIPIFEFLSDIEIAKIVASTGHKELKKGEAICLEGEKSDTLFIINEGQVKLSKITKEGKEQIVHILMNGDFFGELSLFSENERYNFSSYTISNVKLCTLSKRDMDEIIMSNPEISLKILREVTKRLVETENLAQNLATNDAEVRIANMLIDFAEKYGTQSNEGITIKLPVNREEMANYAGVTRETMSRKLGKFENEGIISAEGSKIIIINNMDVLREYVE
jgi:CRP/FNR family transcriptional regulator, anaerobic regulatory protein